MYGNYGNLSTPNMLGLNDIVARIDRQTRLSGLPGRAGAPGNQLFAASLMEAIEAAAAGEDTGSIISNPAEHQALSALYQNAMLQAITGTAADSPDSPTASIADVVFSTGSAHTELLSKINNSDTIAERLSNSAELRDKIVLALNGAGYTANALDSADKISVNGQIYDVIKASKGLGRNAKVQLLEVTEGSGTTNSGGGAAEAIFKAGESGIGLLRQISASFNGTERKNLAAQIQQMMVDNLNANGYTASTHDSPDKIIINGETYDYIQGLNAVGQQAQFQAMKV
ncbi:MAG: hypothetical protein GY950_10290 [bacterium]|nr:hypothetical protein [bacterium]